MLAFTVQGQPESKGSWRPAGRNRRTGGIRLLPDNPAEGAWADAVGWAARAAVAARGGFGAAALPDRRLYQVALDFTLLPPTGRGGRKNRRDIDKLGRSVLDALTGIVWVDDEQVARLLIDKGIVGGPGRPFPGVCVAIAPSEPNLAPVCGLIRL